MRIIRFARALASYHETYMRLQYALFMVLPTKLASPLCPQYVHERQHVAVDRPHLSNVRTRVAIELTTSRRSLLFPQLIPLLFLPPEARRV